MRRAWFIFIVALVVGMLAAPALASEAPVTRHLHMLTTPNGDSHAIAYGVTFHAPCVAFLNLHEIVHETVFGTPGTGALKNPNGPLVPIPESQLGTCTPDR
jgi:hypothetical protein